jgi:hypothetical protein
LKMRPNSLKKMSSLIKKRTKVTTIRARKAQKKKMKMRTKKMRMKRKRMKKRRKEKMRKKKARKMQKMNNRSRHSLTTTTIMNITITKMKKSQKLRKKTGIYLKIMTANTGKKLKKKSYKSKNRVSK